MPTWRQGLAVGQWTQIANTALSSAPMAVQTYPQLGATGPDSKVIAWTGFSIDTRDSSVYSAANGGHNDYAGNEVNRIRLSDNIPAWTEPRAATPASTVVASSSYYADGRPTSRHSYYGSVFNEVRNRAMTFAGSQYGNGYLTMTVDGFSPTAGDWDAAGTYPGVPSAFGAGQGCAVASERSTGNVYTFCGWSIDRWNSGSNTWTKMIGSSGIYGVAAAAAFDTRRNRILVVGGSNNEHSVYDVATSTVQIVSFTGPGAGVLSGTGNGMVYDPLLDAYLYRTGQAGATVYRINAQSLTVDTLPTSSGSSPPASTNGVWTRFLYVPQLKGVAYIPAYPGGVWFLRTY
jgi:hypothetical protein